MTRLLQIVAILGLTAVAAQADGGSETLEVALGHPLLPVETCAVDVTTPTTAAAVLDAAVASGCIASWTAASYPGFGRYVQCIEDVCEQPGTWWAFYLDGSFAEGGVDNTNGRATVEDGSVVTFAYRDWFSGLLA